MLFILTLLASIACVQILKKRYRISVLQILKFVVAKFDSVLPGPAEYTGGAVPVSAEAKDSELDKTFVTDVNDLLSQYRSAMDSTKLRSGLTLAMAISARGNQYLSDNTLDNALLANKPERCAEVLLITVNLIYLLSVVIHPFMPATTDEILVQLNAPARTLPKQFEIDLLPGHKIGKPDHLFKRIDAKYEDEWRAKYGGETKTDPGPASVAGSKTGGSGTAVDPAVVAKAGGMSKSALAKQKKAKDKAEAAALAESLEKIKTPEVKSLEEKVAQQGVKVRDMKTGKIASEEGQTEVEIKELLKMKEELTGLIKALQESQISN